MNILVLGGTSFVGRAIVEDLLARGHTPALFSRGKTNADLFPDVDRRVGDRDSGDYGALAEGSWDATVDVSAYVPRHVAQAGDAIGERGGRHLFISTGSVYDRTQAGDGLTEDTPRLPAERSTEVIDGDTYGPLKVACEDDVLSRYGDRATIVRPGIVAGPYDPTDRFTYWARRLRRGGRVAVPGRLDQPVQVVDSRDLARLVTLLLEGDTSGTYNAVGPAEPVTLGSLVTALNAEAEPVQVAARPGFPLVLPDTSWDVMFRRSRAAADAVGMPATPLEQTARDVLAWDTERGLPPLATDLTPEQEAELLASS
ncbi:MAG: NAD-dependent epimerase/dehydratase family protein [Actinobacteria bacterium]|nr:NAD-dependent epimerase/dehydratase family protein [Actinomycetota bacterium]MCA1721461.1 NAD-dependent epimerase/dehydratase family protein [Actinomycetota bacterium]